MNLFPVQLSKLFSIPVCIDRLPRPIKEATFLTGFIFAGLGVFRKMHPFFRCSIGLTGVAFVAIFSRDKGMRIERLIENTSTRPSELRQTLLPKPPKPVPHVILGRKIVVSSVEIRKLLKLMERSPINDGTYFMEWLDHLELYDEKDTRVTPLKFLCLALESAYETPDQLNLLAKMLGHAYGKAAREIVKPHEGTFNYMDAFGALPYPTHCPPYIVQMIIERAGSFEIGGLLRNAPDTPVGAEETEDSGEKEELEAVERVQNIPVQSNFTLNEFYTVVWQQLQNDLEEMQGEVNAMVAQVLTPDDESRDDKLQRLADLLNRKERGERSHELVNCPKITLSELLRLLEPVAAVAVMQDNQIDIEEEFRCPVNYGLPETPMKTTCCQQLIDLQSWQKKQRNCCPLCNKQGSTVQKDTRVEAILIEARRVGLLSVGQKSG